MIVDDVSAWQQYPQHHTWFNKLWLSEQLGYVCGPGGVPVPRTGWYVVRPIYNLRGMGLGAQLQQLEPTDLHSVPAGYFWCEQFVGTQYSADYVWRDGCWQQLQCMRAVNDRNKLYKFTSWHRVEKTLVLPELLNCLQDCAHINVEFIKNNIIEVHLRSTPDPQYNELIPVWQNNEIEAPQGYVWIDSLDNADGLLPETRLGFYAK
jgi:hypothetical protein